MKKHKYQADIRALVEQADNELTYAEWDLKGRLYPPVCFWSHQIAERSLKALYLYLKTKLYPRTHKLEKDFLDVLIEKDKTLEKLRSTCQVLDQYYIPTRYGAIGAPETIYSKRQAEEAMRLAKEILDFVKKRLKN